MDQPVQAWEDAGANACEPGGPSHPADCRFASRTSVPRPQCGPVTIERSGVNASGTRHSLPSAVPGRDCGTLIPSGRPRHGPEMLRASRERREQQFDQSSVREHVCEARLHRDSRLLVPSCSNAGPPSLMSSQVISGHDGRTSNSGSFKLQAMQRAGTLKTRFFPLQELPATPSNPLRVWGRTIERRTQRATTGVAGVIPSTRFRQCGRISEQHARRIMKIEEQANWCRDCHDACSSVAAA